MLTKPTAQALRSLLGFSRQTGWTEVEQMFKDELSKTYEMLADSADEVLIRQLQGRAKLIREFLSLVHDAPRTLEKLGVSSL